VTPEIVTPEIDVIAVRETKLGGSPEIRNRTDIEQQLFRLKPDLLHEIFYYLAVLGEKARGLLGAVSDRLQAAACRRYLNVKTGTDASVAVLRPHTTLTRSLEESCCPIEVPAR
jgi:hypothetical protein